MCDEIMCGLGRHGQGTVFLSKAWGLEPDAVTFGKSISAGAYPMSGCLVKNGAKALVQRGAGVLAQSHTYAGSSTMALLTGTEVVKLLPEWLDHAAKMGNVFKEILGPLNDNTFCHIHGQGLMWGGQFCDRDPAKRQKALGIFKAQCEKELVAPYYVPVGGWMMTPPMDTKEEDLREALSRIHRAAAHTKAEMAKVA
jgi:adenosylmethionine-8-amino-7-oxononanoate aminotransferase